MHNNYCPYQEYLHEFIVHPNIAPLKYHYYRNRRIIIETTNIIHNILTIQTGTYHYLYWRQFFPIV